MKNVQNSIRGSVVGILLMLSFICQGAYLKNIPYTIQQPDGQSIKCFISGDEYYTFLHDANDYTIVKNLETAYFVYADLSNGEIVPSQYIVGRVNIARTSIKPGINITGEQWKQLRNDFWKNTPLKQNLPGFKSLNAESTGSINNIVVFIRFSDQPEFMSGITNYTNMFNNTTPGSSSMQNYFQEASYGAMNINSSFYPAPNGYLVVSYQDAFPRNYYMPYDATTNPNGYQSSERTTREHTLLVNATNGIASQIPSGLNIDYNNDGYVDNVCYVVKGGTTAWNTLLWPHRWSLYSQAVYLQGNKRVYDYNFQLEDFLDSYGSSVLSHEMFHTLGAPDLYHYANNGIDPAGNWDIMCSTTNPPQHMSTYMKYKYGGWISSIPTLSNAGTYTLNPITSSTNNCFRINSSTSSTEYFVVEFRKKTGTFEGQIPGSGLLIYRINTDAYGNSNGPPDEVYVYRPNGTTTVNGIVSSAYFSSESGRTAFNNTTNPNCFLTAGTLGNITISQIGSSAGNTISFTVGGIPLTANFIAGTTNICPGGTVNFTDLSTGSPTSWLWNFGDGTSSTLQNPSHQYLNQGNYTISLTASNTTSSNTMVKTNYIVAQSTPVSVSIGSNPNGIICSGASVTFTAIPVNGGSTPVYQWVVNGANTGTNSNVFTYYPSNNDVVYCLLTSNIACPSGSPATSNSITLIVSPGSILPQPVFNTASAVVCRNQSNVIYSVNILTGATTYIWSISTGATITSGQGTNTISVNFASNANSGSITVAGVNSCGTGLSKLFNYTVATIKPNTPGSISGPTSVLPGTTRTYTINPLANATTYTWTKPVNTTIVSGQGTTSVTISFLTTWNGGTLNVKAGNCVGTSNSRSLKIRRGSKDHGINNEIEVPQEAITGFEVNTLANGENNIILIPNPASGRVSISYSALQQSNVTFKIFDMSGHLLLNMDYVQSIGSNKATVDITGLSEGIYLVCLYDGNSMVRKSKLIVSH